VGVYFFDSSAVFKRYVLEVGTNWVLGITDPAAGNSIYLASITGVEVVSAFVRQTPPLPAPELARVILEFKYDYHNQYQRLAINDILLAAAMDLAETHKLRGYDAVQLAGGVELNRHGVTAGLPLLTLVSADHQLNNAAAKEGLAVEDPTSHP
jgi:predicted nucleic acid-binding protein